MRLLRLTLWTGLALVGLSGCERAATPGAGAGNSGPQTQSTATLPAGLFVTAPPEAPRGVKELKQSATSGAEVVVRGRIGGAVMPFVEGRAVFTLADMAMPSCAEMGAKDHCPTPWDYCCEPRDNVLANTITVQVVGADQRPLKLDLNGAGNLKPGSEVVLRGKISSQSGAAVVVDAHALFVKN